MKKISEKIYKIQFNHKEMKNIEFFNILNLIEDEYDKLLLEQHRAKTKFFQKRIGYCISAISTLMHNFDRLEKEFRNEIEQEEVI